MNRSETDAEPEYWIARARGSGGRHRVLHTDPACSYLRVKAENMRPASDDHVRRFDECSRCAGGESDRRVDPSFDHYEALKTAGGDRGAD